METSPGFRYTEYSYLSDDELLSRVESKSDATALEVELSARLQSAIDDVEETQETLDAVLAACEEVGVDMELFDSLLQ